MTDRPQQVIIEGLTVDGERFRPSDWIERLLDTLTSYGTDRRFHLKPYAGPERRLQQVSFLHPRMIDGVKCLVIDSRLRDANPAAYEFLMEFVQNNRLRCRQCQPPANSLDAIGDSA